MGKEEICFQGASKFPLGHILFPTHEKKEGETGGGRAVDRQTGCLRKKARMLGAGCNSIQLNLQEIFLKIEFPLSLYNAPNKEVKILVKSEQVMK